MCSSGTGLSVEATAYGGTLAGSVVCIKDVQAAHNAGMIPGLTSLFVPCRIVLHQGLLPLFFYRASFVPLRCGCGCGCGWLWLGLGCTALLASGIVVTGIVWGVDTSLVAISGIQALHNNRSKCLHATA